MKTAVIALLLMTQAAFADTSINSVADINFGNDSATHYMSLSNGDSLIIQSDGGGLNLSSGSSVSVQASGSGTLSLGAQDAGVDITTNTSVTVFAQVMAAITSDGLQLIQYGSLPTCDEGRRGTIFYEANGTGVADQLKICMKKADDSYDWKAVGF